LPNHAIGQIRERAAIAPPKPKASAVGAVIASKSSTVPVAT
jgi:hypothetical protein